MRRLSWWLASALGVAVVLLFASVGLAGAAPLKIGALIDLTGGCSVLEQSRLNAYRMAVDELNQAGGLIGRPVELVVRDTRLTPNVALTEARRMMLEEKIRILIAACSSASNLAVSPVARENRVLYVASHAHTSELTERLGHTFYFQLGPNTRMIGAAMANAIRSLPGWKRIALISLDYEWGHAVNNGFKEKLAQVRPDAQIVGEYWPSTTETNYAPYITAAMAQNPDAVVGVMYGTFLINFIQQAVPYGLFQRSGFLSYFTVDVQQALGRQLPAGLMAVGPAPFFAIDSARVREFVRRYQSRYNRYPDDYAMLGYATIEILKQAIEAAGTDDPQEVAARLESMQFDTILGRIDFRDLDHQADVPMFTGRLAPDPAYPFLTWQDVQVIPGHDSWASEEQVLRIRGSGS